VHECEFFGNEAVTRRPATEAILVIFGAQATAGLRWDAIKLPVYMAECCPMPDSGIIIAYLCGRWMALLPSCHALQQCFSMHDILTHLLEACAMASGWLQHHTKRDLERLSH
jgi:hypothetical protein